MEHTVDPSTINIDNILGVLLICLIIAAYLFGMSSSQTYIYYDRFPKDLWQYQLLVLVTWSLDAIHTGLMSHTAYYYTVTNFGNFDILASPPVASFNLEILAVPIIAFIVQTFFAHRAWAIDNTHWPLAISIQAFSVIQLVCGIIACAIAFTKFDGFLDLGAHTWALIAWLSTSAVGNLLISSSLIYGFWANKAAFGEDDDWSIKILMYGVHTGLFIFIATIIDLAFVIAWPSTLAFAGINYILGKLYTNTLLYALNRRSVTDPRYQSQSNSRKHNISSSAMPTYPSTTPREGNVHSLSNPSRVPAKDPYAPEYINQDVEHNAARKPHLIGDVDIDADISDDHSRKLQLTTDENEHSDTEGGVYSQEKKSKRVDEEVSAAF